MHFKILATLFIGVFLLSGCGGSTGDSGPVVLAAGQTVTLTSGQSIKVPPGTTVKDTSNNVITLSGHNNTLNTVAGAVAAAPANATEVADNLVVAK